MSGILIASVGNSYGYAPINTVTPAITGTVEVGETLSCSTGTWDAVPDVESYSYQWIRGSSTNISGATSSTYTVAASDIGYTLKCQVTATNPAGDGVATSLPTTTVPAVTGQQAYTSAGTYSWVAPAGVTSVSVVAVGGGGGGGIDSSFAQTYSGGGGALAYANNISVTSGSSYTVVVGAGGTRFTGCYNGGYGGNGTSGGNSSFASSVEAGGGSGQKTGGAVITGTGGAGGDGVYGNYSKGGGGAGGYSGAGGAGGGQYADGNDGSGGGGGGGAGGGYDGAGSGGGVGILGEGSSGAGGIGSGAAPPPDTMAGGGGSGGEDGSAAWNGVAGAYGGGGACGYASSSYCNPGQDGAGGAVRVIWPGDTRYFPSTGTADQ